MGGWNKGLPATPRQLEGLRLGHGYWKGQNLSAEHREKLRLAKLGKKQTLKHRRAQSTARKKLWAAYTPEQRQLRIEAAARAHRGTAHVSLRGRHNPNWQGGISKRNRTARKLFMGTLEYAGWRRAVFERDDFTCRECGKRGGELHADHIKPYATHPKLRLTVSNGRTLCKSCHQKTPTWGGKAGGRVTLRARS